MDNKDKRVIRIALGILLGLLALGIGAVCAFRIWARAPELTAQTRPLVVAVSKPAARSAQPQAASSAPTRPVHPPKRRRRPGRERRACIPSCSPGATTATGTPTR